MYNGRILDKPETVKDEAILADDAQGKFIKMIDSHFRKSSRVGKLTNLNSRQT